MSVYQIFRKSQCLNDLCVWTYDLSTLTTSVVHDVYMICVCACVCVQVGWIMGVHATNFAFIWKPKRKVNHRKSVSLSHCGMRCTVVNGKRFACSFKYLKQCMWHYS